MVEFFVNDLLFFPNIPYLLHKISTFLRFYGKFVGVRVKNKVEVCILCVSPGV